MLSKHTQPILLPFCCSPHSGTCKEPGEIFVIRFPQTCCLHFAAVPFLCKDSCAESFPSLIKMNLSRPAVGN